MKIALFTDSFLPGLGGTEKAVLGLANAYTKSDSVFVACPRYKVSQDDFDFPVFRANSLKLTSSDYMALPSLSSKKFWEPVNDFNADIVHCHSVSGMTSAGIKYAKKHHIPVCVTVHTKFRMAFARSIKSKLIVNMLIKNLVKKLNQCDRVFTVSNDMITELRSYGYRGEVTVVRNGATFEKPANLESLKQMATEQYELNNVSNVFMFVGHIVKFKNLQLILDALKIVKDKNSDFKMIFTGKGFDDEYFRNKTVEMGLADCVMFTGAVSDEMLKSTYSAADLFLFPSIFDNDPLVVVEAATFNVPAITIENTGSSERITDGVSGFVTKGDAESFANKILYCMQNKELVKKVGQNASLMIPKEWSTTANEYKSYYEEIITKYNENHKK